MKSQTRIENFNRPWYQWIQALIPNDLTGKQFIDLGGGAGEIAKLLAQRGAIVTFVDNDSACVELAKTYGFDAHQLDLNHPLTELSGAGYDGVMLLDVIEHIWQAEGLLKNIYQLLRPDGYFFLTTPNIAYINKRIRTLIKGLPPYDEGYHMRFFTVNSIKKVLQKNGFTIDSANHATSTFGINRINRYLRKEPINFAIPTGLQNLFVRHIVLRAKKNVLA